MKNILFFTFFISCFLLGAQHNHGQDLDQSSYRFIENKGQWDSEIKFHSKLPNADVYARKNGITYYVKDNFLYNNYLASLHDGDFNPDSTYVYDACYVHIDFLNAKNSPQGKNSYFEKRNYFIGNDSTKWASNVLSYSEIETPEIYEGIDFRMMHSNNSVKYEFHLDKGADVSDIKLKIHGQEEFSINNNGDLVIKTGIEDIVEDHPIAFQNINGKYREVSCQFIINRDSTISYKLGKGYNRRHPIVIDPQLIFSTASGSLSDNWGNTACLDERGNLYSGGTIFSTPNDGFPATNGAFQQNFNTSFFRSTTDIGILKFDSSGQNLIYATYIGGNDSDIPTSIIANDKQELFILGVTGSTNFPQATNAFGGGRSFTPVGGYSFWNGSDITVMKLDSTGSNLIKSRYIGGIGNDGNNIWSPSSFEESPITNYGDQLRGEIIIDEEENIYIASSTNSYGFLDASPSFPVKNGFDTTYNGGYQDGVVFKVHYSLDSLVWSSYLGSPGNDAALSLKLGSDKSLFVTGTVGGSAFNTDSNSYISSPIGSQDAFVARIHPRGDSIIAYSYLGTPQKDISYFVELDNQDNAYLLGQTHGDYGHSSDSIYHVDREGIFIHKLGPELDTSLFYTTIGDTITGNVIQPDISPTAFLVNECGNIFISGWGGESNTHSISLFASVNDAFTGYTTNLPITDNAYQSNSDGSDFYMAVYFKNMDTLLFSTYYGVNDVNEHVDGGTSRFSDRGIVYQSVCAGCGGNAFITFPNDSEGEYPKQNASTNCNNGVFKYDLTSLSAKIGETDGCLPITSYFTNETIGGVDYHWFFGDGFDTLVTTKETIKHTYETPGQYRVTMITTDITTCKRKDTSFVDITISDKLEPQVFEDTLCIGTTLQWDKYTFSDLNYKWSTNTGLSSDTIANPIITIDSTTITYIVTLTDSLNCIREDTINFFVPNFDPNLEISLLANCSHESIPTLNLESNYSSNFTPDSITWTINAEEVTISKSLLHFKPLNYGEHKVSFETELENCYFTDTSSIQIPQIEVPNIITPNGDGKNDYFEIQGLLESTGDWEVKILNRWGKELFYTEKYQNDWKAPIESDGTYFYEIKAPDGSECKGWLQVVR